MNRFVIVRCNSAGVFAGYLKEEDRANQRVELTNARRIWYWKGAASLSQMAMEGVKCPNECRFPIAVDKVDLYEVSEILDTTEKAKSSIEGVPVWEYKEENN